MESSFIEENHSILKSDMVERFLQAFGRQYGIKPEEFDIEVIQTGLLKEAKEFANEMDANDDLKF